MRTIQHIAAALAATATAVLAIAGPAHAAPNSATETQIKAALLPAAAAAKATGLPVRSTSYTQCDTSIILECRTAYSSVVEPRKPIVGTVEVRSYDSPAKARAMVKANKRSTPRLQPGQVLKQLDKGSDVYARYWAKVPKGQTKSVFVMKSAGPFILNTSCSISENKATPANVNAAYTCANAVADAQAKSLKTAGLL